MLILRMQHGAYFFQEVYACVSLGATA